MPLFRLFRTPHSALPSARPASRVRQFDPPVKRSAWRAWWEARRTVAAGVPLQEYLETRLGIYRRSAPQTRLPLPYQIEVVGGRIVRGANPDAAQDPRLRILTDPAGVQEADDAPAFAQELEALRALNRARSEAVLRDLEEKEQQERRLTNRLKVVRERREDQETEWQEAVHAGRVALETTRRRPAEQRGKLEPESVWPLGLCYAVMGGGLLGETWLNFVPFANLSGADASHPEITPMASIGAACFAFGASLALVVLPEVVFHLWRKLRDHESTWRGRIFKVLEIAGCSAFYTLVALALGATRHGDALWTQAAKAATQGTATNGLPSLPDWALPAIVFVVPVALALFWTTVIEKLHDRRRQNRQARWAWAVDENAKIEAAERRQAVLAQVQQEEETLDAARITAREDLQRIAEEAQTAEAEFRATLETERQFGLAWLNATEAALHQDRLAFVQQSRRKGQTGLPTDPALHKVFSAEVASGNGSAKAITGVSSSDRR